MSRQKKKGTAFESAVVGYLAEAMEAEQGAIHRLALHGAHDVGDIGGVFAHGEPVVIECKAYSGRDRMAEWLDEAEAERGNAGALAAVVVSKRRGVGEARMGEQLVSMTLADFAALIGGCDVER